jgi:hypothetical protein
MSDSQLCVFTINLFDSDVSKSLGLHSLRHSEVATLHQLRHAGVADVHPLIHNLGINHVMFMSA